MQMLLRAGNAGEVAAPAAAGRCDNYCLQVPPTNNVGPCRQLVQGLLVATLGTAAADTTDPQDPMNATGTACNRRVVLTKISHDTRLLIQAAIASSILLSAECYCCLMAALHAPESFQSKSVLKANAELRKPRHIALVRSAL